MEDVPAAGHDSMLLNLSGAHGPFFTRNIVDPDAGIRLTGKAGPYSMGFLSADDRALGLSQPTDDSNGLFKTRDYFNIARAREGFGYRPAISTAGGMRRLGRELRSAGGTP